MISTIIISSGGGQCSQIVNRFSPTGPSGNPGSTKNVNTQRQMRNKHDEDEPEPSAFGCTGNAFSYSTLSNHNKNQEADALNPNLYCGIDDTKDNRKLENIYDEIQKRAGTLKKVKNVENKEPEEVNVTLLHNSDTSGT